MYPQIGELFSGNAKLQDSHIIAISPTPSDESNISYNQQAIETRQTASDEFIIPPDK